jgi:hypothetical protein
MVIGLGVVELLGAGKVKVLVFSSLKAKGL